MIGTCWSWRDCGPSVLLSDVLLVRYNSVISAMMLSAASRENLGHFVLVLFAFVA